ncbi:MAG: superoxide dismutase [Asticcacaulis sp.]
MSFELPPLPYAADALEPHMSANTFSFHHGKHHKAYVDNLNKALPGSEFEGKSLIDIIKAADGKNPGVFNNAAQVWNHTFFWHSMKPGGGGQPTGKIAERINADFGSYDAFAEQFKTAGATQFGSGWAWLVVGADGKLKVTKTPNGENPFTKGDKPVLTIDVWEHAYYLDYQNLRPKFIETFLASLVNWDFVNERLDAPLFEGTK